MFSKVGKRARRKLILREFGKEVYRYDYFKAILPSRKYLNDRSVDGRREGTRIDWNAAKAKLLTGEGVGGGGKYRVDSFCRLQSIVGWKENEWWKTRLVRKSRMVKLL